LNDYLMMTVSDPEIEKDYLWLHLRALPYFRSLMRAVEASFYADIALPEPALDLGCGDGHFVNVAFDRAISMGMDPSARSLREASRRGGYRWLCQADGTRLPYSNGAFASAFSNSVLEHIPPVDEVLQEISRVLRPGAPFVFSGPNQRFLSALSLGGFLDRVWLGGLGNAYRTFFNRISRHYHSDSPEIWEKRLAEAGFRLERWWYYYPPDALHVTEWGHYFGLPSLFWRVLTGRWILAPYPWNLWLTERYTRRHYRPEPCEDGVCTFFVAYRN
jgi:SAM-dependent methyltransferase